MQHINGRGNIQVGRDIKHIHRQADKSGHIMRLQAVQITLLLVNVLLAMVNAMLYREVATDMDEVRHMANRAAIIYRTGGGNGD